MSNTKPAPLPFAPATTGGDVPQPMVSAVPTMPAKMPKKAMIGTGNKVIGAKVIVQFLGEDGQVHEAATTVDQNDFKVQSYSLAIEEKHEKKRDQETKDLIGFEDTGERILKFTLRYHVR